MEKINEYETDYQRFTRERNESIISEYLRRSADILSGKTTSHRIMEVLAQRYDMSRYGITMILKRAGVYNGKKEPVVQKTDKVKQGILPFMQADPVSSDSQTL
jgi:hypothetical protein